DRDVLLDPRPAETPSQLERDHRSDQRAERAQQGTGPEAEDPAARDLEWLAGDRPEHHLRRFGQHEPQRRRRAEARARLAPGRLLQPQPAAQHQHAEEKDPGGDGCRVDREPTPSSSLRRVRLAGPRGRHAAAAPSSPARPSLCALPPTRTRARSPGTAPAGSGPPPATPPLPAPRPPRSRATRTALPPTTGAGRTGPPRSGSARSPSGPPPAPRL